MVQLQGSVQVNVHKVFTDDQGDDPLRFKLRLTKSAERHSLPTCGCVSVSHHVNETWSVVLVSLGSGTMCDVARYRIRASRKVMSLRVGGQQLFSLSYSRNGIP